MSYKDLQHWCRAMLSRVFIPRNRFTGQIVRYSDREYEIQEDGSYRRLTPKTRKLNGHTPKM